MKLFAIKTGVFFLALLLLFSSTSFSVSKHLCGGEVVSVSYYLAAEGCGMEPQKDMCPADLQISHLSKTSCCGEETMVFQGSDFLEKTTKITPSKLGHFFAVFPGTELSALLAAAANSYQASVYRPPPLFVERIVLYESFLI